MILKQFQEFLDSGIAKKQAPNIQRAMSIISEAESKKQFIDISIKSIPREKLNANVLVDQCYDILMELTRAKMFIDGYNAGNSHEAEVSYLKLLGFSEPDVRFMNELRYYRNGTKYYGTMLNMEYADKVLNFMKKIFPILKEKIK